MHQKTEQNYLVRVRLHSASLNSDSLNMASTICVRIEQMIEEQRKKCKKSSLTVGAVLLIFSILTVTYSVAGKEVILYCEVGIAVPLRDNFKNTSQISCRSIQVMLTLLTMSRYCFFYFHCTV